MTITRRVVLSRVAASVLISSVFGSSQAWATGNVVYTYDALGRISSVTYPSGKTIAYAYDAAGNRTQVVRNGGGSSGFNQTIPVTGTGPINLRTLANNAGYNGAQDATVEFQIGNGVAIAGSAASGTVGGIAIDSGTWPGGFTITLTLHVLSGGTVRGGGGAGGVGGYTNFSQTGGAGFAGGDAVYCRLPMAVTVDNGGTIQAGGGGGGGGGGGTSGSAGYGGGGGGGGFPNGVGGAGGSGTLVIPGSAGAIGTTAGGGAGGGATSPGAHGGTGGGAAAIGIAGAASSGASGGAGGSAGYAIRKNGNTVNVTNNGTITGSVG